MNLPLGSVTVPIFGLPFTEIVAPGNTPAESLTIPLISFKTMLNLLPLLAVLVIPFLFQALYEKDSALLSPHMLSL